MSTATTEKTTETAPPEIGALVAARGQRWVVSEAEAGDDATLVTLQSVEEGRRTCRRP